VAQAGVINFDTPALIEIDNNTGIGTYSEGGFAITGLAGSFLQLDGAGTGLTAGLALFADSAVTLTSSMGAPFSFAGLDAGLSDPSAPGTLTITGFFENNTQQNLTIMLAELSRFTFTNWNDLTSLSLSASADLVVDSLVVDADVPEPGSIAMIALGLVALGAFRGAGKRNQAT
jgi:hypothetical protein